MRTMHISKEDACRVIKKMRPIPALVYETMLRYGLRISDVIDWRVSDLQKGRWTLHEKKTGKSRRIACTGSFRQQLLRYASSDYVFPGRGEAGHITRQAVWHSFRSAACRVGLCGCYAPHSLRKAHAVDYYNHHGLSATQRHLNHDSAATTLIYAIEDFKP